MPPLLRSYPYMKDLKPEAKPQVLKAETKRLVCPKEEKKDKKAREKQSGQIIGQSSQR